MEEQKIYYIYTMSINGIVFYVGMTADPIGRYYAHYFDKQSACYWITRFCLCDRKQICKMSIIDSVLGSQEARKLERYYINTYQKISYLLNCEIFIKPFTDFPIRFHKIKNAHLITAEYYNIKEQIKNKPFLVKS